jgi:Integrase core domain
MNILYSLQHLGYTIPPQADAGWIGEAGPGPSYLDPGSGGPDNDFTNRNTTFMTWNLIVNEHHLRRVLDEYLRQYNAARPHRALGQLAPAQVGARPPEPVNLAERQIRREQVLGGLTHEYYIAAFAPHAATER